MMRLRLKEEQIAVFTAVVREIVALTEGLRITPETIRQAPELHIPVIIRRFGDKKELVGVIKDGPAGAAVREVVPHDEALAEGGANRGFHSGCA
jgi:hypothetical protein